MNWLNNFKSLLKKKEDKKTLLKHLDDKFNEKNNVMSVFYTLLGMISYIAALYCLASMGVSLFALVFVLVGKTTLVNVLNVFFTCFGVWAITSMIGIYCNIRRSANEYCRSYTKEQTLYVKESVILKYLPNSIFAKLYRKIILWAEKKYHSEHTEKTKPILKGIVHIDLDLMLFVMDKKNQIIDYIDNAISLAKNNENSTLYFKLIDLKNEFNRNLSTNKDAAIQILLQVIAANEEEIKKVPLKNPDEHKEYEISELLNVMEKEISLVR